MSLRILQVSVTALAVVTLLALGCSDDSMTEGEEHGEHGEHGHDAGEHDDGHDHTSCGLVENCEGTAALAKDLSAKGKAGKFTITVLSNDPLSVRDNGITLGVKDAKGAAVKDATIVQDVFSADCMHNGPKPPQDIDANADGNYEIAPVFEHEGPWDVTIEVSAGGTTDTATFHFCVPGHHEGDAG